MIAKIDRRQVVDVRRGPHRDDYRHGQCSGHVYGPQHGIRISRAHDAHMQLMPEADIADEGPLPGSSTAHPPAEPPTVRECGALSERRREWASPAYYSKRDVPSSVMMPARLGEGVIAMLPRSPWPTITPAPGRSCARPRGGGRGRNLGAGQIRRGSRCKFGAAVGQVLAVSHGPHTRAKTQGRAASWSTGGRKIWRGTDGSKPLSSSKESANFRSLSGGRIGVRTTAPLRIDGHP